MCLSDGHHAVRRSDEFRAQLEITVVENCPCETSNVNLWIKRAKSSSLASRGGTGCSGVTSQIRQQDQCLHRDCASFAVSHRSSFKLLVSCRFSEKKMVPKVRIIIFFDGVSWRWFYFLLPGKYEMVLSFKDHNYSHLLCKRMFYERFRFYMTGHFQVHPSSPLWLNCF